MKINIFSVIETATFLVTGNCVRSRARRWRICFLHSWTQMFVSSAGWYQGWQTSGDRWLQNLIHCPMISLTSYPWCNLLQLTIQLGCLWTYTPPPKHSVLSLIDTLTCSYKEYCSFSLQKWDRYAALIMLHPTMFNSYYSFRVKVSFSRESMAFFSSSQTVPLNFTARMSLLTTLLLAWTVIQFYSLIYCCGTLAFMVFPAPKYSFLYAYHFEIVCN